ncbi:MAG: lipopolysaccharide kinase InaA family protein [Thermodesulfobacteriota bacterium]|nr:lipopolysaccharide kinase InaA family protein [Thermodesulfobacteriota bacterium]
MFKKMSIPVSYSLIQIGKTYLLLHNDYKESLLQRGIEEVKTFLKRSLHDTHYHEGRTLHPSIPLEDGKRMVLRQYSHGGLLGALTGNLYLIGSRSFRELALTEEIRSSGIPTIQPIGGIHQIVFGPFYRTYLLSLEIPHAKNLIQYFQQKGSHPSLENLLHKRKTIRSAGGLLGQFHRAGFYHNDLQLKNLLVVEDQVLIIDFDRSYRKATLSLRERIKNLLRLNRSVEKWKRFGLSITRTDRWRFLMAYAGGDQEIIKAIRKVLPSYSLGLFFHRCGWALEKIVRS